MILRVEYIYWLCGALVAACSLRELRVRRWAHAAFWGILAAIFLLGDAMKSAATHGNVLPEQLAGAGVIALGLIAGFLRRAPTVESAAQSERRGANATRLGHRLFLPALLIPFGTLVFTLLQPFLHVGGIDQLGRADATLLALGLACVLATIAALILTRSRVVNAVTETGRLLDALSWAVLLPMLLAMLGAVFAVTGVGEAIAHLTAAAIPVQSRLACVLAFAAGMVAFTAIMGNAFAAFPVMMAGVGLPLLIGQHHAQPAVLGALGMLTGYCGTLLTPMAANFNIVPAALLELRDTNGVIRAQWPTALWLLAINLILIWLFAFP
ncbi:MAG: DUF979 domain-containing protein [Xanthomonadaceae bacterium]|nr:DUF979 domain-containing protein [Xanthomonadaceae bacterium]MDE2085133.1 DUF979 domain-containing protein [Xanthomonadaceae bacterium]